MPPVPQPDMEQTGTHAAALPPRPTADRPATGTFDFIDLSDPDVALPPTPAAVPPRASTAPPAAEPPLTPTDLSINLPSAHDPEAVVGNPEPVDPVAPASGWLDSDVLSIP